LEIFNPRKLFVFHFSKMLLVPGRPLGALIGCCCSTKLDPKYIPPRKNKQRTGENSTKEIKIDVVVSETMKECRGRRYQSEIKKGYQPVFFCDAFVLEISERIGGGIKSWCLCE
jgi:hypothetical protein